MRDWAVYFLILSVGLFAAFNGVLMFVMPHAHRRFLSWMIGTDGASRAEPSPRRFELERRITGLALLAMGAYFAKGAISGLKVKAVGAAIPPQQISGPTSGGGAWFSVTAGLGLLSFGIFVSVRPDWLVGWSARHQPAAHAISDSTRRVWRIAARVLGAAFVWGGLYTLWVVSNHGIH